MISGNLKYIKDIHYQTADAFLKAISYGGDLYSKLNGLIYRGHYSDKFELVPSLLRSGSINTFVHNPGFNEAEYESILSLEDILISNEYEILRAFFEAADWNRLQLPNVDRLRKTLTHPYDEVLISNAESWLPEEFWELAALAQHYGLPTRLLDWSFDIYTSLYFACYPILYESSEMQERIFNNKKQKSEDIPKIELWAMDYFHLSAFSIDMHLNENRLKVIRPSYSGNPNLAAQKGVFTLWNIDKTPFISDNVKRRLVDRTPLDKLITGILDGAIANIINPIFYRITLPKTEIIPLLEYVLNYGANAAALFPGYAGVCRYIEEENRFSAIKRKRI